MKLKLIFAIGMLCLLIAADEKAAVVEKPDTKVQTKTFDPRRPPSDMPKLRKSEAAVTGSKFACQSLVEAEIKDKSEKNGKPSATIEVTAVKMTLGLDVTIWLPSNVTEKIRAHEEGHHKIDERFYKTADKSAQAIAQKIVGKTYTAEGKTSQDAVDAAIKRAADDLNGEYMDAVQKPSSQTQEIYDEITDHGRNKLAEDEAIEKAIARATKTQPEK